ncbi:ankyrin repeat domain-containing protein [Roseibium sp. MMSF_3544]|uniref:ankyrin repeat domain-containing protein n=1 Tax=unclassified Roseibium TaxID=2629323 RepID=UPI00273CFC2A|nr:ankyrin repeat domain-containing protein [Roseibium sp. MMSF_3544]
MAKRPKKRASLQEILQSTSLALFPAQDGRAVISIDTADSEGDTALHILAHRGDRYGCRVLLEEGADPNLQGDLGYTPLHYAVMKEDQDLAALLLEYGANAGVSSEFGETPAAMARERGFKPAGL